MTSATKPKTVLLRGSPLALEDVGAGAITPGHVLEKDTTGTVSVHSAAGGLALPLMVAREEEYVGGGLDTAYADGDNIPYYVLKPGDQFYGILATGQTISIGELVESAGNGQVRDIGTAGEPIAKALEAVTTTGAVARIRLEAI